MLGRIIVVLLVAASAFFVMLQRLQNESTAIEHDLTTERVSAAAQLAAEQQRRITELSDQLDAQRAKTDWQDQQLAELAQDCTPATAAQSSVSIRALRRRPARGDMIGSYELAPNGQPDRRFTLVLEGDAADISRVRLAPGLEDGTLLRGEPSCDTLEGRESALLGVVVDGRQLVKGFGPLQARKPRGISTWELRCDADLERGMPLVVEIVVEATGVVRHAIAPAPLAPLLDPPPYAIDYPLDASTISRVVRLGADSIASCVAAAGRSGPSRKQRLEITVEPRGVVTEARFLDRKLDASPVGRCISTAAKRWRFPAFAGQATNVEIPLLFPGG